MASMWTEFKQFAIKGNVVDMAVGIMIGAAFGGVVNSAVNDLVMPPLGLLTGGLDLSEQFVVLREGAAVAGPYASLIAAKEAGAVVLTYGQFLNSLVSFFLIAGVLFFVVRWMNNLRSPDTPPAPTTRPCPYCRSVIDQGASRCAFCTSEVEAVKTA